MGLNTGIFENLDDEMANHQPIPLQARAPVDSPGLCFARPPSQLRKEGNYKLNENICGILMALPSFRAAKREGRPAKRRRGESTGRV